MDKKTYARKRKTTEELKAELNQYSEQTIRAARKYTETPAEVLKMTEFMSRFPTYSPRNQLLIRSQYPGAKAVAGFQKLSKELGARINTGEHALKIFAPRIARAIVTKDGQEIPYYKASQELKAAIKKDHLKIVQKQMGYHMVNVFDVTQTNLKPEDYPKVYPNRPFEYDVDGKLNKALTNALDDFAKSKGVFVSEVTENIDGATQGLTRTFSDGRVDILIDAKRPDSEKTQIRLHELGHMLLHSGPNATSDESQTPIKELQAELISAIVSKHYGMDTSEHSVPYIASWTEHLKALDDKDFASEMRVLNDANKAARNIILECDPKVETVVGIEQRQSVTRDEPETKAEPEKKERSARPLTKEQIARADQVDIVEFARAKGIELKAEGGGSYRGVEHDSLVVEQNKNYFDWNAQSIAGGTIKFATTFVVNQNQNDASKFVDAVKMLNNDTWELNKDVKPVKRDFDPKQSQQFATGDFMTSPAAKYLNETRGIHNDVMANLHELGILGSDHEDNVLMKWKDPETGKIVGGTVQGSKVDHDKYGKRGTLKHIEANSTTGYGFQFTTGEPRNLKFFESEVDLMSYVSLHSQQEDTRYVSMDGLKSGVVMKQFAIATKQLGETPDSLTLNVDNDEAGANFVKKINSTIELRKFDSDGQVISSKHIESEVPDKQFGKDWNDALKNGAKQALEERRSSPDKVEEPSFFNGKDEEHPVKPSQSKQLDLDKMQNPEFSEVLEQAHAFQAGEKYERPIFLELSENEKGFTPAFEKRFGMPLDLNSDQVIGVMEVDTYARASATQRAAETQHDEPQNQKADEPSSEVKQRRLQRRRQQAGLAR